MSLAHKLYNIGRLVTKEDIKNIITFFPEKVETYSTLQIDFEIKNEHLSKVTLKEVSLDNFKVMFTKKIGGTSNSYYLYPNFEFQKEGKLYRKFKSALYTFENSLMRYANGEHQKIAKLVFEYIKAYGEDELSLKSYGKGDYILLFTINGKTVYELMPEVWDNYYEEFVDVHISKKVKGVEKEELKEMFDPFIKKRAICGYNPNIKFFTMDNYHDSLKSQIIGRLPFSKESAITVKKGWIYVVAYLKFFYKGLEYIIIPSMVTFDERVYIKLLRYLKDSNDDIANRASREDSFVRRLERQIENFDPNLINQISLDILFTQVDMTNLSVKIFASMEDVIPSRINSVSKKMKAMNISADISVKKGDVKKFYLRDYFSRDELFAISNKLLKQMKNRIREEKIYLAKLLLGYEMITYNELLKRFAFHREYDFEHERRLVDSRKNDAKVKEWLEYPDSFVKNEDTIYRFLQEIEAIA